MKTMIRHLIVLITVIVFNLSLIHSNAHAGIIDTSDLLNSEARSVAVEKARHFLVHDEVRQTLLELGVHPEWVSSRIEMLSDNELVQLSENIDRAPAGAGVVEVVGIVFIVLIILELVGVTDIFKKL